MTVLRDDATRFGLGALATWRLTHLLAEEDGPAEAVVRLRRAAGTSWIGDLLDCFYCLSLWTAAPVAVAVTRRPRQLPLVWLALSGSACLLERLTQDETAPVTDVARESKVGDPL
ncbi:MAG TPA: DUF1360 domain-containing protein [Gaiellaceae bacterium]|nr:DUF1360 domain-containing protein [Gaiellaceae bacterium]